MPPTLRELAFRPPFDAGLALRFLGPRALPGVEEVGPRSYRRTLPAGLGPGVAALSVEDGRVAAWVTGAGAAAAAAVARRGRRLFDLDADPGAVAAALSRDPLTRALVQRRPGVRVPGAFDGFEVAVRAVLGQQVSVAGATTLAGRLVRLFGTSAGASWVFPPPEALADASLERVGLPRARAAALRALAGAVAGGRLSLEPGAGEAAVRALLELPGIGPWTASYVAMRALGDRDAIPLTDLGLRRALERLGADPRPAAVAARAERWRPYRAYAAMLLWTA